MLTDVACRKAVCPADRDWLRLSDSGGLYLEVSAAGGKSWRWKYRVDGKEKRLTIGRYPAVGLQDARRARDEARDRLGAGVDPGAGRRRPVPVGGEFSFEAIARRWHAGWCRNKDAKYAANVLARFEAYAFPDIGPCHVNALRGPDFVRVVKAIEATGAEEVARRVLESCKRVMRFAATEGAADRNTAADVMPVDVFMVRERANYARVDLAALPLLLRKIDNYPHAGLTRAALQLMALTFVRTSELNGMRWGEIEGDLWTIPKERMKARRPHVVPLARQALAVLDGLRVLREPARCAGDWLVFPGIRDHAKPMSNGTILKALDILGYKGVMTGHGFRGVASTQLNEMGFRHDVIEAQLAHIDPDRTRAAYNHAKYLPERRELMQRWADWLDSIR